MVEDLPAFLPTILSVVSLSLLPFLVVMGTAFTKISIVLLLLRNAMGVQQAPSGLIINALALTLTIFIMYPVGNAILVEIRAQELTLQDWDSSVQIYEVISGTFVDHLNRHTTERELDFIMSAAMRLWPEELHGQIHGENIFLPQLLSWFCIINSFDLT